MARVYIVQEATLLRLVYNWLEQNPGRKLGVADYQRSSTAWDAIAVAGLSTCLAGLFPTALYAMYTSMTAQRKLAAGIPMSYHGKTGSKTYSSKAQRKADTAADMKWRETRAHQRQDHQATLRRKQSAQEPNRYQSFTRGAASKLAEGSIDGHDDEEGPRFRLGRARRLVAAAESALNILRQQEAAVSLDPERQAAAHIETKRAVQALAIGRQHLAMMEAAVSRASQQHHAAYDPPTYRTGSTDRTASSGRQSESSEAQTGMIRRQQRLLK